MRPIKFRAWDTYNKEWTRFFCLTIPDGELLCDHGTTLYIQEHIIIEQFTTLKDMTGKEIYEGDIVQVYKKKCEPYCEPMFKKGVIVWREDAFWIQPVSKENWSWRCLRNRPTAVIGNIHENPELLE